VILIFHTVQKQRTSEALFDYQYSSKSTANLSLTTDFNVCCTTRINHCCSLLWIKTFLLLFFCLSISSSSED